MRDWFFICLGFIASAVFISVSVTGLIEFYNTFPRNIAVLLPIGVVVYMGIRAFIASKKLLIQSIKKQPG